MFKVILISADFCLLPPPRLTGPRQRGQSGSIPCLISRQQGAAQGRGFRKIPVSLLPNSNQPKAVFFSFQAAEMYFMFRGPSSSDPVIDDMYSTHMLRTWSLSVMLWG